MIKLSTYFFLLFWIIPFALQAQLVPQLAGARAAALGMGAVTSSDIWAIQNNIGALGSTENPSIAFAFNTRLNLKELTTYGALVAYPIQKGSAAASFTRYGTGAYSLTTAGFGYSHSIDYISVGIKVSYLQQAIEGYISQGTLVLEAGGKAELLPKLHFGAHAFNLTQSAISKNNNEYVPVILKAGLEYLPGEKVLLLVQTFKEVDYPARFSTGLEYKIIDNLHIRTGIQTKPAVASFGLGFRSHGFQFDYGFRHHNTIGAAHHLTINVALKSGGKP